MAKGIGDRFQTETKYDRNRMEGGGLDWQSKPPLYKTYPDQPQIALPKPGQLAAMPLDRALRLRRSVRRYTGAALSLAALSYLLWASTGIQREERGHEFRTAPSAGALYPIETYVVANRVADLAPGLYHYEIQSHGLAQLDTGDYGLAVAGAALGQRICALAQAVFVWTAIFQRSRWKYKQRCYRYVYLDAGHVAENLALAATAANLGTCQIGAIFDDEANELLGLDGVEESVIYMSTVGHPAE